MHLEVSTPLSTTATQLFCFALFSCCSCFPGAGPGASTMARIRNRLNDRSGDDRLGLKMRLDRTLKMTSQAEPTELAFDAQPRPHPNFKISFIGILLAIVVSSLDQNIVSTALPSIASELGGVAYLSWIVTAFMLTSTISAPIYGKLSDMYGRRRLFTVSIAIFLTASVLCTLV